MEKDPDSSFCSIYLQEDLEWVHFVHESLFNSPPAELESKFKSLLNIELSSSTLYS